MFNFGLKSDLTQTARHPWFMRNEGVARVMTHMTAVPFTNMG